MPKPSNTRYIGNISPIYHDIFILDLEETLSIDSCRFYPLISSVHYSQAGYIYIYIHTPNGSIFLVVFNMNQSNYPYSAGE